MGKKLLLIFSSFVLLLLATGFWLKSLIPPPQDHHALAQTVPADLDYLRQRPEENRGKILAVVTSTATLGDSGKSTGYELTELARPYYVFVANGFEVDIASPRGGLPSVVIDNDDMGPFDYAFLNDPQAQGKLHNSIPIEQVADENYRAVFFVGGKGAMFDFPDNPAIQRLVRELYRDGKVIGAVCHGPAALVNVVLDNGRPLVAERRVSGFTNEEELFLIPDARKIFPFLLEDKLRNRNAVFEPGPAYLRQVSIDGGLLTGQNPWSVWPLAEAMVRTLGYNPAPRQITAAENTVEILLAYETQGLDSAGERLSSLAQRDGREIDRRLMAMHGIVAVIRGEIGRSLDLVRLLAQAKKYEAR
ncbi:type 1 glutamine amidotransferase domain-containing protein [Microbulbifer rhizosphaerae]|uniref:Putative intracellular protease/amidase n=1 Tax=Microbulbifer rhizosphaerae TaxID=1562603 RepID=A0A7W4WDH1_9GAMM|nr:type 1 glutamine amidotransferase domain-containing protein [Microbulbifer rhizosphaerae]MBB3062210.1 putative intracellular protease/amidase [Microbulbifer rhizosphaerae]